MSTRTSHKQLHLEEALQKLKEVLQSTQKKKILVIGDVMLDVFIRGTTDRMSPEAPVPILKETTRDVYLGGASNTALNVHELGAHTTLIGVIGDDENGKTIQKLSKEHGITTKLVVEPGFPTTSKTRAVGPYGHMLRIDNEAVLPISKKTEAALIASIEKTPKQNAVVISDYAKGVMTQKVIDALVAQFGSDCLLVDCKPSCASLYGKIGLFKVNVHEAKELTGIEINSKAHAEEALLQLRAQTEGSVIITRGKKGLSVYDRETGHVYHVPQIAVEIKDVVGAGDTTLAALAVMSAHNNSLYHGSHAANFIAAQAVARSGTTALSKEEILPLL